MDDPFHLQRFLKAQAADYETALGELRRGKKRSHWIWYIFPQVDGLGHSPMAEAYAVKSRREAAAYLAHPLLAARLRECAEALLPHAGTEIADIMDFPDDLKLCSSMTLFAALSEPHSVFHQVLQAFFSGRQDTRTLDFLEKNP